MSDEKPGEGYSEAEVEEWFEENESSETADEVDEIEDPAEKYARSQLRVVRETKDYQLDYLRHALLSEPRLIDTSPTYQRRLRWPARKRSLLIESFLLNIPIPPVFLFEHEYNEYEVIDGRQRLESIRGFFANDFALTGLEYWSELNRKRFNDLPSVLQKGLLRRSLPAVILLAETRGTKEDDLDVRTVLFDRLNTGGIKLNAQELRNALNPGPFNKLLIRLARSAPFTTTWRIPPHKPGEETEPSNKLLTNTLFKSMTDAELVLRYFSLRDAIENDRHGSLRRIQDRFMKENAEADDVLLSRFESEYVSFLERLVSLFEGKPFCLPNTGQPSRSLYDALMIALSRMPKLDLMASAVEIKRRLQNALSDRESYDVLTGRGNTIEAIRGRVELASKILDPGWEK